MSTARNAAVVPKRPNAHQWFISATSTVLGLTFIFSAILHIANLYRFLMVIAHYDMLPRSLVVVVAAVIPFTSLVIGVLLLLPTFVGEASRIAAVLLSLFIAAQALAVSRGLNIRCGCFGHLSNDLSWMTVIESTMLGLLAGTLSFMVPMRIRRGVSGNSIHRAGVSMIEVIVVMLIIAMLLGLLAISLSAARETSRQSQCRANLRQLAMACASYDALRGFLPQGTLGDASAYDFHSNYFEPLSSHYWKRFQYTSSLAFLLPHLDDGNLTSDYLPIAFDDRNTLADLTFPGTNAPKYDWFGALPMFRRVSQADVPIFRCPSDGFAVREPSLYLGAIQPVYDRENATDAFAWINVFAESTHRVAVTNYAGCTGAHSGGDTTDPNRRPFTGLMSSRSRVYTARVHDGMTHTVLYGEILGSIENGERNIVQSWFVGALARGRGNVPWATPPISESLFGDARAAFHLGYASIHDAGIFVCFGDGHVDAISRNVDWQTWYRLCGAADNGSRFDEGHVLDRMEYAVEARR